MLCWRKYAGGAGFRASRHFWFAPCFTLAVTEASSPLPAWATVPALPAHHGLPSLFFLGFGDGVLSTKQKLINTVSDCA